MKKIYIAIFMVLMTHKIMAQELEVFSSFNNTETTESNDLLIVTTMNIETSGVTEDNGLLVSAEVVPLLLIREVTAVKDLPMIEGLSLFPNPVVSTATLQRQQAQEPLRIQMMSTTGMMMSQLEWMDGSATKDLSFMNFTPGLYIIRVINAEGTKGSDFKVVKR